MLTRIESHKEYRPNHWIVIEESIYLADAISQYSNEKYCIIIDCLTLWITNLLLADNNSLLTQERDKLVELLPRIKNEVLVVSNETNMGIMPMGELSRKFGDEAGITNQLIAECCDQVVLTVAGLPLSLKGDIN